MRAVRTSITAPTKATNTAPTKKYFSTSALFHTSHSPGSRLRNLENTEGQLICRVPAKLIAGTRQTETVVLHKLRDGSVEHRTDLAEGLVDIDCQSVHSDYGGKADQGDD